MKRIILFLSLLLPVIVSAQNIQDTFFGQKLGTKVSETAIKKGLEGKFSTELSVEKAYPITAYKTELVTFGGIAWECALFCGFFDEPVLGSVVFMKKALDESSFEQDRKNLQEALTNKYGKPENTEDHGLRWEGENGMGVKITLSEEEGILGIKYQTLSLAYYSIEVVQKYKDQISDEL